MKIAYAIFFIILLSSHFSVGQNRDCKLSEISFKIKQQFIVLQGNINNSKLWDEYLNAFPRSRAEFKKIFDPNNFLQLYDNSEQYIFIFNRAPESKRLSIFERIISIIKEDAPACCDAWSALHMVVIEYINNNIKNFVSILNSYSSDEREKVVKYLADVENHWDFKEYQAIIDNLRKIGEEDIAVEFEGARNRRMKMKHD